MTQQFRRPDPAAPRAARRPPAGGADGVSWPRAGVAPVLSAAADRAAPLDRGAAADEVAPPDGAAAPRRATPPDPRLHLRADELRVWRAFLRSHAVITRRLEAELSSGAGLSLADYDVLIQLAFAGGRLRMHELADRVVLSRSGISRLIDRLVTAGYVRREHCAADARGAFAVLTEAGAERLRQATPVHLSGVRRSFLSRLGPGELAHLAEVLERLDAPSD